MHGTFWKPNLWSPLIQNSSRALQTEVRLPASVSVTEWGFESPTQTLSCSISVWTRSGLCGPHHWNVPSFRRACVKGWWGAIQPTRSQKRQKEAGQAGHERKSGTALWQQRPAITKHNLVKICAAIMISGLGQRAVTLYFNAHCLSSPVSVVTSDWGTVGDCCLQRNRLKCREKFLISGGGPRWPNFTKNSQK